MTETPRLREVELLPAEQRRMAEAAEPRIERQLVVVVGIGARGGEFAALDNSPRDATAMADLLQRDYGFVVWPSGQPLLNDTAGQDAIRDAVTSSLQAAADAARWLFYFAGHGLVVDGEGFLVPAGARRGEASTYLPLRWLLDACLGSACAETLIILDACYSGRALVRPDDLSDLIPAGEESESVRQIISSGNPDQPVLDAGGSGHSVFTQSLLEALEGWAGIHEADGSIRFPRLLDHLAFDVPGRLRALNLSAAHQQPIGGNLSGHRSGRGFVFQSIAPRLPPETVQGMRSDDPARRRENLARLVGEAQARPECKTTAVQLALRHLASAPSGTLVTHTLRYEPSAEARAQAATALGLLADATALATLIAALSDVPEVGRAAARALGQLADVRAAPALLNRLKAAEDGIFLDLVAAVGAVGVEAAILEALRESLRRGRLVPFVGPDFPSALTGLPDRTTLARELAQQHGLPPSDSLAAVAAATMRGGNRFSFTSHIVDKLNVPREQPGTIYPQLAALNVNFWISGAYDDLLPRRLSANSIVQGSDTQYWQPDRPVVVRLAGTASRPESLLVVERDYEQLRENEGDRHLLVSYLREALQGKVVLLLGYDPNNPDFEFLNRHILNKHWAGVDGRAFLVWPGKCSASAWNGQAIGHIAQTPQDILSQMEGQP